MFGIFRVILLLASSCLISASHFDRTSLRTNITSYAALGDSYATGAGAGRLKLCPPSDFTCGRFTDAYPIQIATRLNLYGKKFKNLACGGTTSAVVRRRQVPGIGEADLITLTVGGNEVDFFPVLNECIQQWNPRSSCDAEIGKARSAIQSVRLMNNFEQLVTEATKRIKPGSRLMITGYARFFNDETNQCDQVTFSKSNSTNYLTRDLRKRLNQLILMFNNIIKVIAEEHGAVYVDVDRAFEGHRFCEENIQEPAPERRETWFFNDWTNNLGDRGSKVFRQYELLERRKGFGNYHYWQTFHPTTYGHLGIAEEVIRLLQ